MRRLIPSQGQGEALDLSKYLESFMMQAYAGTGKSTTLDMISRQNPDIDYLYIVFNRENMLDAKRKFPANVDCTTAHGLAYHNVIGKKYRHLLTNTLGARTIIDNINFGRKFAKLDKVTTRVFGLAISDTITKFCQTIDSKISQAHIPTKFLHSHAISHRETAQIIIEGATKYWELAKQLKVPVTHDMYVRIWYERNPRLDQYDCIMYDEFQDADNLMVSLLNKLEMPIIAVGDTYQQIYSFRGAVNAFEKVNIDKEVLLKESYRYGPDMADFASDVLNYYYGTRPDIIGYDQLNTKIHYSGYGEYTDGPIVKIGRTNHQLVDQVIELIKNDQDAKFYAYFDFQEVKSILFSFWAIKNNRKDIKLHPILEDFDNYDELSEYISRTRHPVLGSYRTMYGKHGPRDITKAIKQMKAMGITPGMLKEKSNVDKLDYVFISAHKCKGLEFSNVTLLDDFYDKDSEKFSKEEANLMYVATSRAQQNFYTGTNKVLNNMILNKHKHFYQENTG